MSKVVSGINSIGGTTFSIFLILVVFKSHRYIGRIYGYAVVFVNSSKGNKLLKNIKDKIHLETRTLEDVLIGNPYLFGQAVQKGDRERFFKLLDTKPFSEAVKATYTENVTQKMKRYIKLFLKRVLKRKKW